MELLAKAGDAASMFWQSLDERERVIVLYLGVVLCIAWLGISAAERGARERERIRAQIREELSRAD